jgi:hypothetical protein
VRGRPDALGSPRERIERLRRLSERQRSSAEEATPRVERRESPRSAEANRLVMNEPPISELWLRRWSPPEVRDDMAAAMGPPPAAAEEPPAAAAPARDDSRIFIDLDESPPGLELRRVFEDLDADAPVRPPIRQAPLPEPPHPLVRLLARLDRAAGQAPAGASAESWTRADLTPDIVLTVRGLDPGSAPLLERIARLLRSLIEDGRGKQGG